MSKVGYGLARGASLLPLAAPAEQGPAGAGDTARAGAARRRRRLAGGVSRGA